MPPITLAPIVALGGSSLADDWQNALVELHVDHRMQVPARCRLRFSDPGYVLAQDGTASVGTALKVTDPSNSSLVLFNGEVTSLAVEQQMGEQPELVVVAHDKSHRLGRSHNVQSFDSVAASDIVTQLAGDAGLMTGTVTATSTTFNWALQADTDLGAITELARRSGRDWYVLDEQLYFVEPNSGSSVSLKLADSLLSFSVKASAMYPTTLNVRGWDIANKQALVGTGDASGSGPATSTLASGVYGASSELGSAGLSFATMSPQDQGEADAIAGALAGHALNSAVSASGVTYGNGAVAVGTTVEIQDSGPLAGSYPVTHVEHSFRPKNGFLTRFFSGDAWPTTLVDSLGAKSGVPKASTLHNGLIVATVSSTKDPNNSGKVQLTYPGLDGSLVSYWGRVAHHGAGGGGTWGTVFMPEVGSEVLVGFENSDLRRPVVLAGLYNGQDTVPGLGGDDELIDDGSGAVNWRGIKSRTGHYLLFNDTDGSENAGITIQTGSASSASTIALLISGDDNGILIKTNQKVNVQGQDCTVTAQGTLTLQGQQKVSIQAPQIEINADQQFSVSSPQVSLQGDTTASLQGGTVSVEGDSTLSLSAPSISIGPG